VPSQYKSTQNSPTLNAGLLLVAVFGFNKTGSGTGLALSEDVVVCPSFAACVGSTLSSFARKVSVLYGQTVFVFWKCNTYRTVVAGNVDRTYSNTYSGAYLARLTRKGQSLGPCVYPGLGR
jgi:hypothetical protein